MKKEITTKTTTYLKYSLSREEQEILIKSNKILNQFFGTIEECTGKDISDFDELIDYFNCVFNEDIVACHNFILCGVIDTIINHSNDSFIAVQDVYTDD